MAIWQYTALSSQGKELSGELEAKNQDALRALLTQKRLRLVKAKKKPMPIKSPFGTGITSQDVGRFTRQFSAMNEAGLPLLQALDILQEQTENPAMREVLQKVGAKIQGGGTLSEAFQQHPKIFSELYCHMVSAGEAGGILDQILRRLAEYQEKAEKLKRKIKGAMMYPVIVLVVAVVVVAVLMVFVVPIFAKMFESAGGQLPAPTRIVMQISDFFKAYILHMIAAVAAGLYALKQYYKTDNGRLVIDKLKIKTPGIGNLETKSSVARFTRTLGTLLNSGVSIIDALHVTGKTSGNRVMEIGIEKVIQSISGGNSISEPLKETGIFPPMVVQMIGVGEKSGALPDMLLKISDFYDEEVDAAVDALTSMIEPIIIVFLGVVIGGILVAMYLPMFSLSDTVK